MPTEAMPVTALAVLFLLVSSTGLVGALFVTLIMMAVYRERRDIRIAKRIAERNIKANKAKKEIRDRARRLKEKEAKADAEASTYFEQWKVFVDGSR